MEADGREQRLRSRFGIMMIRTALTIVILGFVVGTLLDGLLAGGAFGVGLSESSKAAAKIAADLVVGAFVLMGIVRAYLAPVTGGVAKDD